MSRLLLIVTQVGLSAMLLRAGLGKIANPRNIRQIIYSVGVKNRSKELLVALILTELGLSLAIILAPSKPVFLMTAALGTGFGFVGLLAVFRRLDLSCNCFGGTKQRLGWHQVVAIPGWFAPLLGFVTSNDPMYLYPFAAMAFVFLLVLAMLLFELHSVTEPKSTPVLQW